MNIADHVNELAAKLVNNHAKFDCFGWSDAPTDRELWCIVYTTNRDADVVTRSNHNVYTSELAAFDDDTCIPQHHGHWACGWVEGFVIRVYDTSGNVTPAFECYATLHTSESDYPVLNESDYSECEAQDESQAWEAYARADIVREAMGDEDDDRAVDLGAVYGWYHDMCNSVGRYPEHNNEGCSFPTLADLRWDSDVNPLPTVGAT